MGELLALTIDERGITLGQLEGPPDGLAELRAALLNEHEWRQRTGLDPFAESLCMLSALPL